MGGAVLDVSQRTGAHNIKNIAVPRRVPRPTADCSLPEEGKGTEDALVNEVVELNERSVMLIDDSMAVRKVIEASFQRAHLPTTTFADGLAAIHALAKGEVGVPDVLLLDIGLPRMTGYEVARILRSNSDFHNTKIVMLTAKDGVVDKVRAKMIGACEFIPKPFHVSHLVQVVLSLLSKTPGDDDDDGSD